MICQDSNININPKYFKAPKSVSKSPLKLATYLTESDSSESQKALNIYTWIVHNIKYDVKALRRIKSKTYGPKQTLKRKKGLCHQYSSLFSILCQNAGLSTREVIGYSRGATYKTDDKFYEVDHSWNGIKLDSTWHLVDPTWGSGYIRQKKQRFRKLMLRWFKTPYIMNQYKYVHEPNYRFFLTSPEILLSDHLPANPTWQLVEYPISLATFESSEWNGYNDRIDSHQSVQKDSIIYLANLNKYEYLSDLQYLQITADKSHEFNSKNLILKGYSSYLVGLSVGNSTGDLESKWKDKAEAITYHKRSIGQLKRHQRNARATSKQVIRVVKSRIGKELKSPISLRKKRTQSDIKDGQKFSDKIEKRLKDRREQITKVTNRIAKGFRTFKKPALSRNIDDQKLEDNLVKTDRYTQEILSLQDSITLTLNEQKELAQVRQLIQNEIRTRYGKLSSLFQTHIELIKSNLGIEVLSTQMSDITSTGQLFDSLTIKARELQSTFKRNRNSIVQWHTSILSKSKNAQKLIFQNCQLSKNTQCNVSLYKQFNTFQMQSYESKLTLDKVLLESLKTDVRHHNSLIDNLDSITELMTISDRHVTLFEKVRIGGIGFKLKKSLKITNDLILKNQQQIRKLSIERQKLKAKTLN